MVQNHQTEAACLIEHGAQYRCRVGLRSPDAGRDPIFAGFKAGAFSLFFGDSPFYHFDLEGRWQRAVVEGTHFLKGLDGRVQVVDRVREGRNLVLRRHILTNEDAGDLDGRIRSAVLGLIAGIDGRRLERTIPPASKAIPLAEDELRQFLERIARWDAEAWAADRQRYLAAYGPGPVAFLPPECQNAVVVRATLGHAGGVNFGGLAAAAPFARSLAEFQEHATLVAQLWGRRLSQSRLVFLAGSDLFRQPVPQVAGYLDVVNQTFPMARAEEGKSRVQPTADDASPALAGVHALLGDFLPPRPDCSGWSELANRGLDRVSLGVESGDPEIRAFGGKDYTDLDLAATVRDLKSAGVGISLLTLVGAGGVERAEAHVRLTARLFASLDLGPGDFVFLLDENEIGDSCCDRDGVTRFDRPSWMAEQARLKEALAPLKQRGVKVLPYTFDKQPP